MFLPEEVAETFDWLEAQGWLQTYTNSDPELFENQFLSIYPPAEMDNPGTSFVTFNTTTLKYSEHWSTPNADVDARIFEIARTSGDGGRTALWLDPDGKQWFVHLGHDELGVICDDAKTLLTFLAMGYPEPGGFAEMAATPLEQLLYYHGFDSLEELEDNREEDDSLSPPVPPVAFQNFLTTRFGITFPERASDLGIRSFDEYGHEDSPDAFVNWMNSVTPPPTEEELAYIKELSEMAEKIGNDLNTPSMMDRIKGLFGRSS